jgi:LEA14-like dessication related protein
LQPKTRNIIIASAVAGVGIGSYAYYKYAMNNFGFEVNSVGVNNVSGNVANINLKFNIWSKLGVKFEIKLLQLNLYANGVFIGTVQQEQRVTVPENGTSIMQATALIDLSVAKATAFDLITSMILGNSNLVIEMKGYCKFKVNLPLLSMADLRYDIDEFFELI